MRGKCDWRGWFTLYSTVLNFAYLIVCYRQINVSGIVFVFIIQVDNLGLMCFNFGDFTCMSSVIFWAGRSKWCQTVSIFQIPPY